jgi:hypothetical protein
MFGAEIADLSKITKKATQLLTKNLCIKYNVIPISIKDGCVTLAMANIADLNAIDTLHYLCKGNSITVKVAYKTHIRKAIQQYYE